MSNPLVSVIMPAYNFEEFIAEAMSSVFAQTYRPIELIIVDDGSSDGTLTAVEGFQQSHGTDKSEHFSLVCVSQKNTGPSAARNRAMEMAGGRYISMLDADDKWPATKLEIQVKYMESHPDIGLVFGDAQIFDDKGIVARSIFEKYGYYDGVLDNEDGISDCFCKLLKYDLILNGTEMTRRVCFEAVGRYREDLTHAEDVHLWLRIAARFGIGYIPHIALHRRLHESNTSRNYLKSNLSSLRALEDIYGLFPGKVKEYWETYVRKISEIHCSRGYHLFSHNEMQRARKAFWASLRRKINSRALAYYLLTFLHPAMVRYLKTMKQHFSS